MQRSIVLNINCKPTVPFNFLIVTLVAASAVLAGLWLLPAVLGLHSYNVSVGSMDPALREGDAVLSRSMDPNALNIGDVVTYRVGSGFTTSRIDGVEETNVGRLFIMKSDVGQSGNRETVFEFHLVGKVVASIAGLGHMVTLVDSSAGKLTLILGPALALLLMWAQKRSARVIGSSLRVGSPSIQAKY